MTNSHSPSSAESGELADLRRDVIELREWQAAVLGKCRASDGFQALPWGGNKDGWGFVHFFIGHLETRALDAETALAEQIQNVGHNPATSDVRWGVNYLLEQIAAKFEAWETMDLFRSDAASTVRSFKHDLTFTPAQDVVMREALEKISGAREYDPSDYEETARYKRSEGIWTVDEYLADRALAAQPPADAQPEQRSEVDRLKSIIRSCVHGAEMVDLGGGEIICLHLPNKDHAQPPAAPVETGRNRDPIYAPDGRTWYQTALDEASKRGANELRIHELEEQLAAHPSLSVGSDALAEVRKLMRRAMIDAKCTSPDTTYVQEGMESLLNVLGAAIAPLLTSTEPQSLPKWRHLKRGSIVTEVARGFAQVAHHPIEEMTAVVIYKHDADGVFWVRNAVEFDDGRFEPYPLTRPHGGGKS